MLRLHDAKTKAKKRQRSRATLRRRTTHLLAVDDVHGARVGPVADSAVPTPSGGNGEALLSIMRSTTINTNGVPPQQSAGYDHRDSAAFIPKSSSSSSARVRAADTAHKVIEGQLRNLAKRNRRRRSNKKRKKQDEMLIPCHQDKVRAISNDDLDRL